MDYMYNFLVETVGTHMLVVSLLPGGSYVKELINLLCCEN